MGRRDWWQRSLNRHFRLLEGRSAHAVKQRRRIEEERIKAQQKQALEHQEKALERIREAIRRSGAISGMDRMERKKIARELTWRARWNAREAKISARARECR